LFDKQLIVVIVVAVVVVVVDIKFYKLFFFGPNISATSIQQNN